MGVVVLVVSSISRRARPAPLARVVGAVVAGLAVYWGVAVVLSHRARFTSTICCDESGHRAGWWPGAVRNTVAASSWRAPPLPGVRIVTDSTVT